MFSCPGVTRNFFALFESSGKDFFLVAVEDKMTFGRYYQTICATEKSFDLCMIIDRHKLSRHKLSLITYGWGITRITDYAILTQLKDLDIPYML